MSNNSKFCLEPESGDSKYFGNSIAINDRYLVVGDPRANKVVIYQKNIKGQWQRNRFIYPPENSISSQIGNGFGRNIKIDRHSLMIESLVTRIRKDVDPNQFPFKDPIELVASEKYFIQLDENEQLVSLDFPLKEKRDLFQFYDLYKEKPRLITLYKKESMFSIEYTDIKI